ncbi:CBS domain-containing protein [Erwinia sp. CPCC 100877]|nr:CBS domain-containing protein [Erwinia sp. CPCC 100877]
MTEELLPNIVAFLQPISPFNQLPAPVLNRIAEQMAILYLGQGETLEKPADGTDYLYIVRTGTIEQRHPDGRLRARLGDEDIFGFGLLHESRQPPTPDYSVQAIDNTLIYRIGYQTLLDTIADYPEVTSQLALSAWSRMESSLNVRWSDQEKGLFFRPVEDVANRNIAIVSPQTPIQEVAQIMRDRVRTSCAFVVDENRTLIGMITDKDMTKRVVACGHDIRKPIASVMTDQPHTVYQDELVIRAINLMMQYNIQNIPVVNRQRHVVGLVTPQQLVQKNSVQAIFLIEQISRARNNAELQVLTPTRQAIFEALVDGNVSPAVIAQVLTMIYDAFTRRLTELVIGYLGEPPCAWSWMAAGSHARGEVHLSSDQDNALLLDDGADTHERHYFNHFAMYVNKGLTDCGYSLCSGRFMAATPIWCQRLTVWQNYYRKWATNPEYERLLNLNVFIEIRHVAGDNALFRRLDDYRHRQISRNARLLAALLRNALRVRPPLGIFHNLVLEKDGDNKKVLNIKRAAIHCLVDLVRIYALHADIEALNTGERILQLQERQILNEASVQDMLGTWRYATQLRYLHQRLALSRGELPDNTLDPARFGSFERQHLKDAFSIISGFQEAVRMKFGS